jgi:colicin import membrane protein
MGASLVHDKLLPRPPGGIAPGAALAVVVHAGLIAALTLGVDWRTHSPEVVSAELWAAVPQSAAPPPPPPVVEPPAPTPAPTPAPAPPPVARTEPPPPPPDIALERERKKAEAERKKAELKAELKAERQRDADKKKADDERKKREQQEERRAADKAAQQKAAEQAEDERLAKQREENLRRMMGQAGATAGATGTTGSAAQNAAPSATYAGKVKAAVRPNIVFTGMAEFNAAAEVEVSAAPGGSIIARRLIKSSGYKDWDEAVLRAIDKTRNLPRDTDGRVPTLLIISFRPNE